MQDGRQARTWMMAMEMVIAEVEEVGEKVEEPVAVAQALVPNRKRPEDEVRPSSQESEPSRTRPTGYARLPRVG